MGFNVRIPKVNAGYGNVNFGHAIRNEKDYARHIYFIHYNPERHGVSHKGDSLFVTETSGVIEHAAVCPWASALHGRKISTEKTYMKTFVLSLMLVAIGSIIATPPANAGTSTEALNTCVADNTTGKDRKDLAQWIFMTIAAHPEIQPFSNVTEANRDEFDKRLADLATRLITVSCKTESKSAIEKEGSKSLEAAFETLGRLAMQELMSNPSVNSSFTRYVKYLDKSKFEAAFSEK